ncbi:MAG: iron uptake porin [Leptolyngbyaceae cyanobacterium bins.59]|nr:iron uptake porin [Leptolyngbyaceae cyanobacterium bins.59]
MSKLLLKSLLVGPAALGAALAVSSSAMAAGAVSEQVAQASTAQAIPGLPTHVAQAQPSQSPAKGQLLQYSAEGQGVSVKDIDQVTSVSQLSDVQPTDWAFQALQSLVERYGCIVGYPDSTFRGSRPLTRYEFAAGLNACMDRVNELIAAATADLVTKEDLETLRRLQEEFAAELATLRGRVDALEARTAKLEAQQFSTTTKLVGEVIFAISSPLNNPNIRTSPVTGLDTALDPNGNLNAPVKSDNQVVFQNRVRLNFQTSFTGRDLLVTRLDSGNAGPFALPGNGTEATQAINFNPGRNTVNLGWLAYYLPLGDKGQLYIPAYAGLQYDYAPTISPYLDAFDGGTGPLSIFAQRNPIYDIGGGSGVGLNYNLSKNVSLSLGYLASNGRNFAANLPQAGNGLFNGNYSALAQLTFNASDAFSIGLTYVNAYRKQGNAIYDTGAGTAGSAVGTNVINLLTNASPNGTAINSYGASASFKFSPRFAINGWVNYTAARSIGFGDGDIWSYAVGLAFPDLGRAGNLGGIVVGVQPYLAGLKSSVLQTNFRNNNPIHVEGFYKYQVSDNISITPGVIWIIAPGQDSRNDNIVIGTLRTTFTF